MAQFRDDEVMEIVVRGLKTVRSELKLTMEVVYNDTGLNISRIEGGNTNITISTLKRLCSYYNITLKEFFDKYCEEL